MYAVAKIGCAKQLDYCHLQFTGYLREVSHGTIVASHDVAVVKSCQEGQEIQKAMIELGDQDYQTLTTSMNPHSSDSEKVGK